MVNRRQFLAQTGLLAASAALVPSLAEAQTDEKKPLDRELVERFVGRSHFDLAAVKEMHAEEPALVNAAWDWGDGDWETGLGAAAHTGQREIALFLLDHGARIDLFAATMLGQEAIVLAVLDAMPAIHQVPGPHGIPLLSHAVFGRQQAFPLVQLLLDRGAAADASSFLGMTPLMAAASLGHLEAIDLLLRRGADPGRKDRQERTALAWAQERQQTAAVSRLQEARR